MCKQKFLLLKQNEDTDAEKISNLAEPTETPCAKLVPEPGVPDLGTGTLPPGHRATARSLEVKI